MAEVCERLVQAGLPLWRVGIFVRTLHPDIYRPQFHLEAGRRGRGRHGRFQDSGFAGFSRPARLSIVFQQGLEVRARVDDPQSKRFPIIEDMRAEGVTDYIALPLLFTDGSVTRLELDHQAAGRLHRRAAGGVATDSDAAGAADRDHQLAPHGVEPARYLCRQPRRRADSGRPDPARPHRDDERRDLAVRSARLHRAVGPAAGRDRRRHPQSTISTARSPRSGTMAARC